MFGYVTARVLCECVWHRDHDRHAQEFQLCAESEQKAGQQVNNDTHI